MEVKRGLLLKKADSLVCLMLTGKIHWREESCHDVPGGPVAKTLNSQCRGPRVQALVREPDAATKDPVCCN